MTRITDNLIIFWCIYGIVLMMLYTSANASAGTDDFWLMEMALGVVVAVGLIAGLITWRKGAK